MKKLIILILIIIILGLVFFPGETRVAGNVVLEKAKDVSSLVIEKIFG